MRLKDNDKLGLKLAGAILLSEGELTIEEMKAIPFFSEDTDVEGLFRLLKDKFKEESYRKKTGLEFQSSFQKIRIQNVTA